MKKRLSLIIPFVVAVLIAVVLWPKNDPAPTFQIQNLQGQTISNAQLKGKVTLINFWYPSCPGCVSEMPKLVQLAHDYQGKDFQILGISLPYDPLSSVQNYAQSRQLPFTVMYDTDGSVGKTFGVQVAPTSFFINKQGNIIKHFVGEPNFTQLRQSIDTELQK